MQPAHDHNAARHFAALQEMAKLAAKEQQALADGIVVPDVVGEVIGYRAWNVVTLGKLIRLSSATHGSHWPTGDWIYATCGGSLTCDGSTDGRVPGEHCSCGMYAARDLDQLRQLGYGEYDNEHDVVMGEVGLVGKVIPGDQGWRAQKARVVKLLVPHEKWRLGKALSITYNVPFELAYTLRSKPRNV